MNPFEAEDEDDETSQFDLDDPTPEPPSVEIEPPKAPEPPDLDIGKDLEARIDEVNEDTLVAFVACVVLTNVALLGISLGAMLLYFRGDLQWGGLALGIGVLAGIRAYLRYRKWERTRDRDDRNRDRDDRNRDRDDERGRDRDDERGRDRDDERGRDRGDERDVDDRDVGDRSTRDEIGGADEKPADPQG